MTISHRFLVLAATALTLGCAGCGKGTADLKGQVTSSGKPVVVGSVQAFTADGTSHLVELSSSGSFSFADLAPGKAIFTVNSPDLSRPTSAEKPDKLERPAGAPNTSKPRPKPRDNPTGWFPIPTRYSDPEKSGLTFDLRGGSNNFDLRLDP